MPVTSHVNRKGIAATAQQILSQLQNSEGKKVDAVERNAKDTAWDSVLCLQAIKLYVWPDSQ